MGFLAENKCVCLSVRGICINFLIFRVLYFLLNVLDYSMTFTVEVRGNFVKFGCDKDEFQITKPGALGFFKCNFSKFSRAYSAPNSQLFIRKFLILDKSLAAIGNFNPRSPSTRTRLEVLLVRKLVFGTCGYVRAMLYKSDIDLSRLQGCARSFTRM